MNCLAFTQRLDAGDLDAFPSELRMHTAGCESCARALVAARSLESAFVRHLSPREVAAPAGLVDVVMARVRLRHLRPRTVFLNDPTPWWVSLAAQPSAAGALSIAALLTWRGSWLLEAMQREVAPGGRVSEAISGWLAGLAPWTHPLAKALAPPSGGDWVTALAIWLCLSPLVVGAGFVLYRAGERLFVGPVRASGLRPVASGRSTSS